MVLPTDIRKSVDSANSSSFVTVHALTTACNKQLFVPLPSTSSEHFSASDDESSGLIVLNNAESINTLIEPPTFSINTEHDYSTLQKTDSVSLKQIPNTLSSGLPANNEAIGKNTESPLTKHSIEKEESTLNKVCFSVIKATLPSPAKMKDATDSLSPETSQHTANRSGESTRVTRYGKTSMDGQESSDENSPLAKICKMTQKVFNFMLLSFVICFFL